MAAAAGSQHRCVFVGNIPYDATEEQLIQICEEVGPVVSFRLVLDRETGKPKGYGFCEYKDEETALSARRNLQGYEINGRQLRVDFAENDKGTDRNREQGRGGPGLTSNADAHKGLAAPSILGDSTLHQPIGHPIAATAASAMARTLGGAQTGSLPLTQNGLQSLSGLGNDPLTHYLARMSRQQMNEIMSEMKTLAVQNKPLAQQLLQGIPQLSKALFQAEIMLGMVTPQMMQMASNRQSLSTVPKPAVPDSMLNQKPLLPPHQSQILSQNNALVGPLSRPPETQLSNALQNPLVLQQSAVPFQHVHAQPPYQQPLPSQPQIHPQGMMPGISGIPIRPQPHVSLANQPQIPPLSKGLISQVQPLHLHHSRSAGVTNVMHHPPPAHQDMGLQSQDLSWTSRASTLPSSGAGLAEQHDLSEVMNHRLKRPRLEEGGGSHPFITNSFSTISSVSAQPIEVGRLVGSQMHNNAEVKQHTEKQKSELLPEVESALLQQVMNLTPNQLSSLTPEQQRQVLQLQQMLR